MVSLTNVNVIRELEAKNVLEIRSCVLAPLPLYVYALQHCRRSLWQEATDCRVQMVDTVTKHLSCFALSGFPVLWDRYACAEGDAFLQL